MMHYLLLVFLVSSLSYGMKKDETPSKNNQPFFTTSHPWDSSKKSSWNRDQNSDWLRSGSQWLSLAERLQTPKSETSSCENTAYAPIVTKKEETTPLLSKQELEDAAIADQKIAKQLRDLEEKRKTINVKMKQFHAQTMQCNEEITAYALQTIERITRGEQLSENLLDRITQMTQQRNQSYKEVRDFIEKQNKD